MFTKCIVRVSGRLCRISQNEKGFRTEFDTHTHGERQSERDVNEKSTCLLDVPHHEIVMC